MKEIKFKSLIEIREHLSKGEMIFDQINHYSINGWSCSEGCCQYDYDPNFDGSEEDFIEYLIGMIKDRNEETNYEKVYDFE